MGLRYRIADLLGLMLLMGMCCAARRPLHAVLYVSLSLAVVLMRLSKQLDWVTLYFAFGFTFLIGYVGSFICSLLDIFGPYPFHLP